MSVPGARLELEGGWSHSAVKAVPVPGDGEQLIEKMADRNKKYGSPPALPGGYDEERFEGDVPAHFKCPICLDVLKDPVQCSEEHVFCTTCIYHYLACRGGHCPQCKLALAPGDLAPWPRVLRNMLSELKLRCVHASMGCTVVTTVGGIAAHERACPYRYQLCRYCRASIKGSELNKHELTCEQRALVCERCSLRKFPNKQPAHDCVVALKQRIVSVAGQLEQQKVNFQERLRPYEEYVRAHEAGAQPTWREVQARVRATTDASRESFHTSKTPQRTQIRQGTPIKAQQVNLPALRFSEQLKQARVELRDGGKTITSQAEDEGGIAVCDFSFGDGVHYWEVRIEAMWDNHASDGSIRLGLALEPPEAAVSSDLALGDDQTTIGWWDSTVDGAVFQEWEGQAMREGDHCGILVDATNHIMELYVEKVFISELRIPGGRFHPAFYTKTHFDRLTIIDNPTPPAALSL